MFSLLVTAKKFSWSGFRPNDICKFIPEAQIDSANAIWFHLSRSSGLTIFQFSIAFLNLALCLNCLLLGGLSGGARLIHTCFPRCVVHTVKSPTSPAISKLHWAQKRAVFFWSSVISPIMISRGGVCIFFCSLNCLILIPGTGPFSVPGINLTYSSSSSKVSQHCGVGACW